MNESNPYAGETGRPQLIPSFTAFLDVLGFKARTLEAYKQGRALEELEGLIKAMEEARDPLQQAERSDGIFNGKRLMRVRFFTDSLVIALPLRFLNPTAAISNILSYLGQFQMKMACAGYFVRGAISFGDLYVDDEIVWGPALIEAVEAEKELARVPRVILCPSAAQVLHDQWNREGQYVLEECIVDADGYAFNDYLEKTVMIAYPDDRPFAEILHEHKRNIETALTDYGRVPDLRAKFEWPVSYHNYFCGRYPNLFREEELIDTTNLGTLFKPLIFPGCEAELVGVKQR